MRLVAFNGRFLTRKTTGVDRFAREIIAAVDGMIEPGEAVLVVPEAAVIPEPLQLRNIKLVAHGNRKGHLWEQVDYSRFCSTNHMLPVNLCDTAPMRNPGIVCLHDMAIRHNERDFSMAFAKWHLLLFRHITGKAELMLTVSQFSKRELEKYYPNAEGRIEVVPNGWQHVARVEADDAALEKYGLDDGGFWFAMSSLTPNKNLRWIAETAKLNPNERFAIAGGINPKVFGKRGIPEASNVKYLGYVSDGEAKALMGKCKGMLYPTFYEGFGLPPMEAMASGARTVAVSDTDVMHEVYGDCVNYIDPHEPCADLNLLKATSDERVDGLLGRYSWDHSAQLLRKVLDDVSDGAANCRMIAG